MTLKAGWRAYGSKRGPKGRSLNAENIEEPVPVTEAGEVKSRGRWLPEGLREAAMGDAGSNPATSVAGNVLPAGWPARMHQGGRTDHSATHTSSAMTAKTGRSFQLSTNSATRSGCLMRGSQLFSQCSGEPLQSIQPYFPHMKPHEVLYWEGGELSEEELAKLGERVRQFESEFEGDLIVSIETLSTEQKEQLAEFYLSMGDIETAKAKIWSRLGWATDPTIVMLVVDGTILLVSERHMIKSAGEKVYDRVRSEIEKMVGDAEELDEEELEELAKRYTIDEDERDLT